jgi:hypothetical protein
MEDVLDVYARPFDPLRPVICLDEKNKELRDQRREPLPLETGKARGEAQSTSETARRTCFCGLSH